MLSEIDKYRKMAINQLNPTEEQLRRGLELHAKSFVCDSFGFLPSVSGRNSREKTREYFAGNITQEELMPRAQSLQMWDRVDDPKLRSIFLEGLRESGVKCTVLTFGSELDVNHSLHRMSYYTYMFDKMRDSLHKCVSPADVDYALAHNKTAVICSTNCAPAQGGVANGPDAHHWIEVFFNFGVRIMHLTYNRRNWVGDGCLEPADGGLSLHGRDVVKQMNELGIAVDTPHTGRRTTLDAAELSDAPIMASHTVCKGVYNHPRGKTDDELKLIGEKGGYIGICIYPAFLAERPSINSLLDHIDHAVEVAGIDHVGIGTDLCWQFEADPDGVDEYVKLLPARSNYSKLAWIGAWTPDSLACKGNTSDEMMGSLNWINWPIFTVGLVKRGYGEEDIRKILGGNFINTWKKISKSTPY